MIIKDKFSKFISIGIGVRNPKTKNNFLKYEYLLIISINLLLLASKYIELNINNYAYKFILIIPNNYMLKLKLILKFFLSRKKYQIYKKAI